MTKHSIITGLLFIILFAKNAAAQNVGIGTTTPTKAGLVVNQKVGATHAIFGDNARGISLQSNPASVGFNNYVNANGERVALATLPSGQIVLDDGGNFIFSNSNFAVAAGSPVLVSSKLVISGAGNVGIGTSMPQIAGLVVQRKVGNVHAVFGGNAAGVAIESNEPTIGFNGYQSEGGDYLAMANGFSGAVSLAPSTGDLRFATSDFSSTAGNLTLLATRMVISGTGNVGIDNINPTEAGLVVDKRVNNTHAIFGRNTNGLSFQSGYPTIGFNGYRSISGYRTLTNGYTGAITFISDNGEFRISSSPSAIAPGNSVSLVTRMLILPNGNVGIGTTNADIAGLVVEKKIGAVHAMFGANTTGVAIESSFPGIGLNSYFSGGRKFIANGFGALLSLDPGTGNLSLMSSTAAGVADAGATLVQRMVINSEGNIGVQGNTAPGAPISFSNTLGNKISLFGNPATGHYGMGIANSLLQIYSASSADDIALGVGRSAAFTEAMRIKGNGNVAISSSITPNIAGLVVNKRVNNVHAVFGSNTSGLSIESNFPALAFNSYYNGSSRIALTSGHIGYFGMNPGNGDFIFGVSGSSAASGSSALVGVTMVLNRFGQLGIGVPIPTAQLQVGTNGDGSVALANAWQTFSDERYKKDIVPIANALEKIEQLNGYYYYWKEGTDANRQAGLLAQEVEKVLPEIVNTDSQGYKSVDYGKMNALLLQALKEQNNKVELLEKQVEQLIKLIQKN
jgi:hypothetical protein